MKRQIFETKSLSDMNLKELLEYMKNFKTLRNAKIYRLKQEAEDEMSRILNRFEFLQKEISALEEQSWSIH